MITTRTSLSEEAGRKPAEEATKFEEEVKRVEDERMEGRMECEIESGRDGQATTRDKRVIPREADHMYLERKAETTQKSARDSKRALSRGETPRTIAQP
jgi:hypothetical protein